MSRRSEFVEFVIDQMAPIGKPRVRAMFGGCGVYQGDSIFAIIVDERLLLSPMLNAGKASESLVPD